MAAESGARQFRPILIPRRGEIIAWASAILTWLVWLALVRRGQGMAAAFLALGVILLLSALLISLGNWVDRNTQIRIDGQGIEFHNGLRHMRLAWNQIAQVRVLPSQWGKKVQVYSERSHFSFYTLGEVRIKDELKGRTGFEQGEEILQALVANCGLQRVDLPGEGYYYARP